MSRTEKRKARPAPQNSRKRQRLPQQTKSQAYSGPAIRGDALKWKTVPLPNRLEDAEGLYGLEEIDDVDVVRDETTNHVMFRPKSATAVSDGTVDDAEWSGFDDRD